MNTISFPPTLPSGAKVEPDYASLQQAAAWFAALDPYSPTAPGDLAEWQKWLDADPRHRSAWAYVEAVSADFGRLPGATAHAALRAPAHNRRRALGALAVFGAVGVGTWLATRSSWPNATTTLAQARTGTGEVRELALADGSRGWLNAATSVEIENTNGLRLIKLRSGEIFVASEHIGIQPRRPLVVDTQQGRVEALGTRFSVRSDADDTTQVTVFEGAVRITPRAPNAVPQTLQAGQQALLTAQTVGTAAPSEAARQAWVDGVLIADNMRLDAFLAELSRYRHGYLGCAPAVAGLRLDGVFPAADSDRVLGMLEQTLPVTVHKTTAWWVSVGPKRP